MIIQKSELDAIFQAVMAYYESIDEGTQERRLELYRAAMDKIEALGFDRPMMEFGLFDLITSCTKMVEDCTSDDIARALEVLGWTVEL